MFWALLDSVNGVEAQPARVDAAVINNVKGRIRGAFKFSVIGIPNSRIRNHSTPRARQQTPEPTPCSVPLVSRSHVAGFQMGCPCLPSGTDPIQLIQ